MLLRLGLSLSFDSSVTWLMASAILRNEYKSLPTNKSESLRFVDIFYFSSLFVAPLTLPAAAAAAVLVGISGLNF